MYIFFFMKSIRISLAKEPIFSLKVLAVFKYSIHSYQSLQGFQI